MKEIDLDYCRNFFKEIQDGELLRIVKRKTFRDYQHPWIYDLNKGQWFKPKYNDFILVLDKEATRFLSPVTATPHSSTASTTPHSDRDGFISQWNLMFVKVLYQEQIGYIHIGWLEKI